MLCSIAMLVYRRVHLLKRVFLKLQLCKKSLRYVSVWPAHPWSIALSHWANHSDRSTKGAAAGLWLNVLFAQKKTFHVVCVCVYVFVFVYVYVYIYLKCLMWHHVATFWLVCVDPMSHVAQESRTALTNDVLLAIAGEPWTPWTV